MYKHFCEIQVDIGLDKEYIIRHWNQLNIEIYNVWHVDHNDQVGDVLEENNKLDDDMDIHYSFKMNE